MKVIDSTDFVNYPIVVKPENIEIVLQKSYFQTLKPEKPVFKQIPPIESDYKLNAFTTIIAFILAIPLLMCSAMLILGSIPSLISGNGDMGNYFGQLLLTVIILAVIESIIYSTSREKEKNYNSAYNNYNEKKKLFEKDELGKFNSDLTSYKNLIESIEKLDDLKFREFALKWYFGKFVTLPHKIDKEINNSTHKLEFYNKLKDFFGDSIFNNYSLNVVNKSDNNKEKYYIPDVFFFNKANNFCLAIEIGKQQESESTFNTLLQSSKTYDSLFSKNGWFVIRFLDDQIKNDFVGCVVFIHKLLSEYDPNYMPNIKIINILKD